MKLFLQFLFIIFAKVLIAIENTPMSDCNIYTVKTFLPNMTTSLIETRHLSPSSMPTVADCALLCLHSTSCLTATFNSQMGTCAMYSESLQASGQLVPASSNDVTTISVKKDTSSSNSFISYTDTVYPVWNVSAGRDSFAAVSGYTEGQYWFNDRPGNLFDGNLTTYFCIFGFCNYTVFDIKCGQNTGVYVTAQHGPFVLEAFCLASGPYSLPRDPLTITIEGSNQNGTDLTLGSSWTLIYNGTSGLSTDPGRLSLGIKQIITNNTLAFASYRVLVIDKRGSESCVEYAEIQLFGY